MISDLKLLEQHIADLEVENAELKTENAEISELRKMFAKVEVKNAKLKTENFEVKAVKLRAELKYRIEKLEKSKMRDTESDKLKVRVAKLEQDPR